MHISIEASESAGCYGLFGSFDMNMSSSCTIKNLLTESAIINNASTNAHKIGIIIGDLSYGAKISNCYVSGTIVNTGTYATSGGIAGSLGPASNIDYCRADISINYGSVCGGIAGSASGGCEISHCLTMGGISNSNTAGGILGSAGSQSGVRYSVSGVGVNAMCAGGLVGSAGSNDSVPYFTFVSCVATGTVSGYYHGYFMGGCNYGQNCSVTGNRITGAVSGAYGAGTNLPPSGAVTQITNQQLPGFLHSIGMDTQCYVNYQTVQVNTTYGMYMRIMLEFLATLLLIMA